MSLGLWVDGQSQIVVYLLLIQPWSTVPVSCRRRIMQNAISAYLSGIHMVFLPPPLECNWRWCLGATAEQIKEAVDWAMVQRRKHPIFIHCAHGHGRSIAVLVACLIKSGVCQSIAEGESMVKSIRPRIKLNTRQKREIEKWMQTENLNNQTSR